ncbi:MAG: homocysteine S-methyltransferase [Ilumatobacteraceae bacterium]|nr:homocysteine S-methyltransferase [Ilumatobacteraceae bacterium]
MTGFLDALASRPLLFDGAMGSLLYDRGVMHTHSYDELNLSRPDLIRDIHAQYIAAGADILESNTFGANRIMLGRHGHADRVAEINQAAVAIARSVADGAFVAGAIGPTGIKFSVATEHEREMARAALREQIEVLVASGVDLLVMETFASIVEIEAALEIARSVAPDLPRVAQMVFDADSLVEGVLTPEDIAARLVSAGADVVGGNCGLGPPELYDVGHRLVGHGAPVSIQPNAGLPSSVDGRTIYVANPEHFGVFARRMLKSGVRLIGGCCGTTPEHIRSMSGAVRMMGGGPARAGLAEAGGSTPGAIPTRTAIVPLAERSRLGARIAAGEFAVSVEVNAPAGTDPTKALGHVREAAAGGIDIVNVADGPRAMSRMSNLAFCAQAIASTSIEPILHVCCRDRNYLGLVAHLLGAHALGIRNLVVITGDPPKMGDYAFATPVYDVDSIGLLEIASAMNAGFDPAGNELAGATSFVLATGAEPAAADRDRELERLERKKAAGAELVMTQPVYDPETLASFIEDAAPIGLPIMVGLLPLASYRNAEFLHNEVPGMQIPLAYRERMAAVSGPAARAEGIAIAREALEGVQHQVAGAYIMPPFNRIDSAVAILDVVRGGRWTPAI